MYNIVNCVYLGLLINLSIYVISPFSPLPSVLSFFPHFSHRFFFSAILPVSLYIIVFLPLTPSALPHHQHDNDIGSIFSRTRNRRICGSISINNLQGFRQYLSHIPTNVVKTRIEFSFLTNGSSELLSNATQPRLGL